VYRRTRKEMPANEVEIDAAEHEGVKLHFLAAPVRVIGDEQGRVTQFEYLKMELGEPDASGRRRPVPIEGSETLMDIDMLITAIGQGPDVSFINEDKSLSDLNLTRWNTIDADPEILQSNIPKIFTAGDSYTGASLVIEAIGGGRRAARAIHLYLAEEEIKPVPKSLLKKHIPESLFEHVDGIKPSHRAEMPELPVEERVKSFDEADLVLSEKDALAEAKRCLNCCRLCYDPDANAA
jgi:NADPH-dependent glutamate synthase beta subunit-like oxidoreductase